MKKILENSRETRLSQVTDVLRQQEPRIYMDLLIAERLSPVAHRPLKNQTAILGKSGVFLGKIWGICQGNMGHILGKSGTYLGQHLNSYLSTWLQLQTDFRLLLISLVKSICQHLNLYLSTWFQYLSTWFQLQTDFHMLLISLVLCELLLSGGLIIIII